MEYSLQEIVITSGPLAERRFAVPAEGGLRLGRASSCEISIPDPALSRHHCLFELRDDAVWITDLASANGTMVNDETLGATSRKLSPDDIVTVGDTTLQLAAAQSEEAGSATIRITPPKPPPSSQPDAAPAADIDLGLGNKGKTNDSTAVRKPLGRGLIWGIAGVVILISAVSILLTPKPKQPSSVVTAIRRAKDSTLLAVNFERVDASTKGIYRYALEYLADGSLHVEFADVPKENRHLSRTVKLSNNARKRLADIFSSESLYTLDPEYSGAGVSAGILKSYRLKVIRGERVFETSVENTEPPDILRSVCESLEVFSKNELGTWALQYSADKLKEMSAESVRIGDAKWNERDVQDGNLSAAIKAYDEAIAYLDTVNPKPAEYDDILGKRETARKELDKRYRDQRFLVERAENMKDWAAAQRDCRVLCDMVPDERDQRHAEATAKLLDIEARMNQKKKGSAR